MEPLLTLPWPSTLREDMNEPVVVEGGGVLQQLKEL